MSWWRDLGGALIAAWLEGPPARERDSDSRGAAAPVIGPAPSVVIGPVITARVLVDRAPDLVVREAPRGAWDAKGWERRLHTGGRTVYTGLYSVAAASGGPQRFRGRVEQRGRRIDAYVADPPEAIRRHPKGPCFALTEPPWFKVHWHRAPKDVDTAILYVERVLGETLDAG